MKEKLIIKSFKKIIAVAILAFVIVGSNQIVLPVSAGSSDIVVNNNSFSEKLDTAKWNAPNGDVIAEKGKLVFSENSTGDTRLITKLAATRSSQHDELFKANYTMKFKNIPANEEVMLAFSLASVEAYYGEAESLEIVFSNNNGLKVGIRGYNESGEKVTIKEPVSCGLALGKEFRVAVAADTDMSLTVMINNQKIFGGTSPIDLEGRIGILQTGGCAIEVGEVEIVSHKYDTPENVNIIEDFEQGGININTLTSKMSNSTLYYPAGIQVEDYNDSKVLMFRNVNLGYFGTTHPYSNFEVTFDIPYMLHTAITREDGSIKTPAHMAFMLTIGDESEDYDDYGYTSAAEGVLFGSTEISFLKGNTEKFYFEGKDFYDMAANEGYSVRVTVVDALLTVEIKPIDGTRYTKIASYKLGDATPLGYIHIWSTGQANFGIDNFCVTNMDKGANLIETEYAIRTVEGIEDWEYQPIKAEYLETNADEKEFQWSMLMVYAAIAGICIIAVCAIIGKVRKTPKNRRKTDEEA